jgi:hypothetical protein
MNSINYQRNTRQGNAQRFALPALGRAAERRPIGKMLRRRKMLENAADSPASGARFVGQFFLFTRLYGVGI